MNRPHCAKLISSRIRSGEIEAARLQIGEEDTLLAKQRVGTNARRIAELCTELAAKTTDSEDSLIAKLESLSRSVRELVRLDPGATEIEQSLSSLASAPRTTSHARYKAIRLLLRRTPSISPKLKAVSIPCNLSSASTGIPSRMCSALASRPSADSTSWSAGLSAARRLMKRFPQLRSDVCPRKGADRASARASAKLAERVRAGLKELGFARSDFSISLERLDPPSPQGNELAEFLFSANPGEPARPLRSIGSSGEISRVMLALKSALADQDDVPVLVFDEIDANVGGEIAAKVATKMRNLGDHARSFASRIFRRSPPRHHGSLWSPSKSSTSGHARCWSKRAASPERKRSPGCWEESQSPLLGTHVRC